MTYLTRKFIECYYTQRGYTAYKYTTLKLALELARLNEFYIVKTLSTKWNSFVLHYSIRLVNQNTTFILKTKHQIVSQNKNNVKFCEFL